MNSSHLHHQPGNYAQSYVVRPAIVVQHPANSPRPPSYHPQPAVITVPWSSGLCHCCDDPENCLITATCPWITFGQIAEIVNEGSPSCGCSGATYGLLFVIPAAACLYSCFNRSQMRARYDLEASPCGDCLVHFCCETCALCQEYRELRGRGFDMGIGWKSNMDRLNRGMQVPPTVEGSMRR